MSKKAGARFVMAARAEARHAHVQQSLAARYKALQPGQAAQPSPTPRSRGGGAAGKAGGASR